MSLKKKSVKWLLWMENLHILLLHSVGLEWVAQRTRSVLPVKLLRTWFHSWERTTFKSTAKASSSSYVTSGPQELSLEERHRVTRLCKGGCGLRCAAQPPRAVKGKLEPRLNRAKWQSTSSPPARGLPARPRRPPKLREDALRAVRMLLPPPAPDAAL